VQLRLQHLFLIDIMFSDITARIKRVIIHTPPSPPWLQDDKHILRFYTGFCFEFSLKAPWQKGVCRHTVRSSRACPSLLMHRCLSPYVLSHTRLSTAWAKPYALLRCRTSEQLCTTEILTRICHSSTSLSLRLLASSRSAILAVYSASSVAC